MSWNCRGVASTNAAFWRYFLDQDVDVALLQEVNSIPDYVRSTYNAVTANAVTKSGKPQRFSTCLLSKTPIRAAHAFVSKKEWVNFELEHFKGNLVSGGVVTSVGEVNVISVYNPAWPIDRTRIGSYDTEGIRLTQQKSDVWLADVLWAVLRDKNLADEMWIVGGDFNLSETFDSWVGGPHGNKGYLDRMASLGMVECLRKHCGILMPTFKNASNGKILHQMDHIWASPNLAEWVVECRTGVQELIFGAGLSDHLPIIADFDLDAG